jgi:uncharacterized protein (TIGR03118 family)
MLPLLRLTTITIVTLIAVSSAAANDATNHYMQTNFVANAKKYKPTVAVEPRMKNAWGIAIRPQGAGGHFWITAGNTSYQYVGDVQQSVEPAMRKLHATDVKYVTLPIGGAENAATSVVFSDSREHFIITQPIKGGASITAPAKFLFSSDGGIISAWTEKKNADGSFTRSDKAMTVIDQSKDGAQFFGLTVNADYSRLYAADFGAKPDIKVFDGAFKPLPIVFDMPFDENKNGRVDAGEYAPFNLHALTTPSGTQHIFVAYAKTQACTKDAINEGACKKGEIYAGEEDTSKPGYGRLAEFTEDGELVAVWNDGGKLSAPWGMAYAPDNFGALSGKLLVANFGDGTIAAFDANDRSFTDVMRSAANKPIVIDKIWGLLFGNGESLGDKHALYFTAGPEDETDGVFGSLRVRQ